MNSRDIIELVTLATGIIVSVVGAIRQIRERRAGDAALVNAVGADAVARSKAAQDIAVDPTFLQQIQMHMTELETQLAHARKNQGPPNPPSSPPQPITPG